MNKYQYHLEVPSLGVSSFYSSLNALELAIKDLGPILSLSMPRHGTFYDYLHKYKSHSWKAGSSHIYTELIVADSSDQAKEILDNRPVTNYHVTCYNRFTVDQIACHIIPARSRAQVESQFYNLRNDLSREYTYLVFSFL